MSFSVCCFLTEKLLNKLAWTTITPPCHIITDHYNPKKRRSASWHDERMTLRLSAWDQTSVLNVCPCIHWCACATYSYAWYRAYVEIRSKLRTPRVVILFLYSFKLPWGFVPLSLYIWYILLRTVVAVTLFCLSVNFRPSFSSYLDRESPTQTHLPRHIFSA